MADHHGMRSTDGNRSLHLLHLGPEAPSARFPAHIKPSPSLAACHQQMRSKLLGVVSLAPAPRGTFLTDFAEPSGVPQCHPLPGTSRQLCPLFSGSKEG
ncbi:uncharacterized protein LOC134761870 [Pongo abelii]|uniref:uncharacterized protein LOC134761870 n=1 Tax=Pongo abelii TaxID=9601 RepID=UPI003005483E